MLNSYKLFLLIAFGLLLQHANASPVLKPADSEQTENITERQWPPYRGTPWYNRRPAPDLRFRYRRPLQHQRPFNNIHEGGDNHRGHENDDRKITAVPSSSSAFASATTTPSTEGASRTTSNRVIRTQSRPSPTSTHFTSTSITQSTSSALSDPSPTRSRNPQSSHGPSRGSSSPASSVSFSATGTKALPAATPSSQVPSTNNDEDAHDASSLQIGDDDGRLRHQGLRPPPFHPYRGGSFNPYSFGHRPSFVRPWRGYKRGSYDDGYHREDEEGGERFDDDDFDRAYGDNEYSKYQ